MAQGFNVGTGNPARKLTHQKLREETATLQQQALMSQQMLQQAHQQVQQAQLQAQADQQQANVNQHTIAALQALNHAQAAEITRLTLLAQSRQDALEMMMNNRNEDGDNGFIDDVDA